MKRLSYMCVWGGVASLLMLALCITSCANGVSSDDIKNTVSSANSKVILAPGQSLVSIATVNGSGKNSSLELVVSDNVVTQAEYEKYMTYYGVAKEGTAFGQAGSEEPYAPNEEDDADSPVYYVNWYEAVMYCNLKSKEDGLTPVYYINRYSDDPDAEPERITNVAEWLTCSDFIKCSNGKYWYDDAISEDIAVESPIRDPDMATEMLQGGARQGLTIRRAFRVCTDPCANGWRLPSEYEKLLLSVFSDIDIELSLREWSESEKILLQAGQSVLAIENQADQGVLSLLQRAADDVAGISGDMPLNKCARCCDLGFRIIRFLETQPEPEIVIHDTDMAVLSLLQ
jgi:hypothetical protein